MKAFDKLVWILQGIIKVIVSAFVLILSVMTFLQVILRYVFHTGLIWNDEFCRFLFVFIIFLILPYASLNNMHMQLDVISGKAPASKPVLRIIAWLAEFIFFSFMIKNGYEYALANANKIASSVHVSYLYIYMIIPIGCALGDVFLIYRLAKVVQEIRSGVPVRQALGECLTEEEAEAAEEEKLERGEVE